MNVLPHRNQITFAGILFLCLFGAGSISAQNSNLQNLIQTYKDQNPQAAIALEQKKQASNNQFPSSQAIQTPNALPQGTSTQPTSIPGQSPYTNLPYQPSLQGNLTTSIPFQPSQHQTGVAPIPYYPNQNLPTNENREFQARQGISEGPTQDYRQLEIPKDPLPLGGNPRDPLNIRFDSKWVNRPNRATTPFDEMLGDARLNDLYFVDAQNGWAVGDHGVIWHTADAGKNWLLQETPIDCTLRSVHFVDKSFGLAVGGYLYPFSGQGRGIVLMTIDGGKNWNLLPQSPYPIFHRVKMFDMTNGILAGESSEYCPSGLFSTKDGGRIWKPVSSDQNDGWNSVDFFDEKAGIGIGTSGTVQSICAKQAIQTPQSGFSRLTQIKLISGDKPIWGINGWMVGDNGLILSTTDRGFRWGVAPGKLPGNASNLVDLKAIESKENQIWVAGNPGSFIYSSNDAGKTWKANATGQTTTIRKIVFADKNNGWAAGDLGTILSTSDGGNTWSVQRTGSSRLAMLGVFGRAEEIPLEAYAQICANNGFLGGTILLFRDQVEQGKEKTESVRLDRTHEALVRIGTSVIGELGSFVLPRTELLTNFNQLVQQIEKENDGKGMQRIRERLVLALRQYRPEIVLSSHFDASESLDPIKELTLRELVEAVKLADDPTAFPHQLTELGLKPWKVKKIHLALSNGKLGDVNVTTTEPIIRLGQPLDELVYASYGILTPNSKEKYSILGFSTQCDQTSPGGSRDFFAGITLPPGSDGRRSFQGSYAEHWEKINLRIQQRRHALGIIQQTARVAKENGLASSDVRLASNAEELTRKIDKDAAVQILLDMGRKYLESGDWDSVWEAYELLARQHADHPLVRSAFLWLVQYYAGNEVVWRKHKNNSTSSNAIEFTKEGATARKPVSQVTVGPALAVGQHEIEQQRQDLEQRLDKAIAIGRLLDQKYPDLADDVRIRFSLASALRKRGWNMEAGKFYQKRGDRKYDDVWSMRARAEYWLGHQDQTELPPELKESPLPMLVCSYSPVKPYLDGQFDKEFDRETWFKSRLYSLTPEKPRKRLQEILKDKPVGTGLKREERLRNESRNLGTQVMFMYDNEYLYVGVRCKRIVGFHYPPIAEKPRSRDADIDDQDRIEILLDVDRDYGTYYSLTIDSRGWAVDSCWGDKTWNPEYFIARNEDKDYWYIEAAIPLNSLNDSVPINREVWAVGLRRLIPGFGIECWNAENSFELEEGFGFLVFE